MKPISDFGICYQCKDGRHGECVGIPCQCDCPIPAKGTDAATDLLEAAELLERAEWAHANCDDCEGIDTPEKCPTCFPLFDEARLKRRAAIAKAKKEKGLI